MAQTGLKAFEDALKADVELQKRYEEALKGVTEASSFGEAVQKAAAELGYEVTLEEFEQAWAERQELDDAELESVAGGKVDYVDEWCLVDFHCYLALSHDRVDGVHNEACAGNYYCIIVYHH